MTLQKLAINNNQLSGPIPATWSSLTQLKAPYLFNNTALSGCIPASWGPQFEPDFDAEYFVLEGTGLTGICGQTS